MNGEIHPLSRRDDIVVQEHDGEILLYDLRSNKAFCLNQTASAVWQACDGRTSTAELSRRFGEDLVWLALDDLKKGKLVMHGMKRPAKFDGVSRRDVIRQIGVGAAVTLPIVASLVAPPAAYAQSCPSSCNVGADCLPTVPSCDTCVGAPGAMMCV